MNASVGGFEIDEGTSVVDLSGKMLSPLSASDSDGEIGVYVAVGGSGIDIGVDIFRQTQVNASVRRANGDVIVNVGPG